MTDAETAAFLRERWLGVLGSVGSDVAPHLVNVGYLAEDGQIVVTSFAAAQKVRNIECTGVATLLVEHPWPYAEVRGVMVSGSARVVRDTATALDITTKMCDAHVRMSGTESGQGTFDDDPAKHAAKRIAVYLEPTRVRTGDRTKLGGTY
ncbi:pyridoxamine 5'-phosphate oxidase family protein [Streptomyces shenzhenensis]|uniref:pyridoxamine 5'-phosphate oxidase family protein n=1 Tax=Streptomyces shenzhenensis TaxID=943815 RepID=UPI0036AAC455